MEDIFRFFFNFIGACTRWFIGAVRGTMLKKKKFPFNEYLNGPSIPYDESINIIVGGSFFFIMILLIINCIF